MYYGAMMIVERMDADIARGVTESYRGQSILGLSDRGGHCVQVYTVTGGSLNPPTPRFSLPLGEK